MKLTKQQLRQIIKEELSNQLGEYDERGDDGLDRGEAITLEDLIDIPDQLNRAIDLAKNGDTNGAVTRMRAINHIIEDIIEAAGLRPDYR